MNVRRNLALLALPICLAAAAACSTPPAEEAKPAETAAPAAATPPPPAGPRAFFIEPADGATVTSPVMMKFGSEGVTISPVPAEVTEVRPGMGHYHLAFDVDCLGPGEEIKKGEKWIHYGKGDLQADTQLAAGSHKLTLAVADDKHMQMPGLCSSITVNVPAAAAAH